MKNENFTITVIFTMCMCLLTAEINAQNINEIKDRDNWAEKNYVPIKSVFNKIEILNPDGDTVSRNRTTDEEQILLASTALSVKTYYALKKGQPDMSSAGVGCDISHVGIECSIGPYFCFAGIIGDQITSYCGTCGVPGSPECVPDILLN